MSDSTGTALNTPSRGDGSGDGSSPARARRGGDRPGRIRSIGTFYRQVIAELRKVIWPTRNELVTYTIVSIVFVTAMVALVALYDFVFTKAVLGIFG